ncbi:phosphoribosylanthranilate isomerase [Parapedobacter sp. 10938]|uniref:phosphoribosylanthranilate isomerase n=1 Tax=Parapedobacter flavus TaxID=3110225 RepID=UPI002DBA2A0C|nr:phosphoribosylanthranilate isomerase [Parapedobacter sp. 10938]MEC3881447.1 phosphoribosylanthranilate isomerase [Parapedobacter sp. 10938]
MNPKIKICGLKHLGNIQDVMALRPDYVGFICYPGSKRFIGELDETWVAGLQGAKKTGVFVNAAIHEVKKNIRRFGFQAVQLHGAETPAYCAELMDGGVEIIKAFGISEQFNWTILEGYQTAVDYYLFDTKSSQHGGTGKRFNWTLLDDYTGDKPFFLSGGISAENMADALQLGDSRLYALDLNSRFETAPGVKDIALLRNTLQTINDE